MKLSSKLVCAGVAMVAAAAAQGQWSDNFDSYSNGDQLHGVNGWTGWDNSPAAGALVSNVFSRSTPNSVDISGGADLIQQYGVTDGAWVFTAYMYVPSSLTSGLTYFIMQNTYNHGGPYDWSIQMPFDTGAGTVSDDMRVETTGPLTIVRDQWVEIRVEIDLDSDTCRTLYNGQELSNGTWTTGATSATTIASLDLYANSVGSVYYDDLSLAVGTPVCRADFDGDGFVTGLDFDTFVAAFEAGDPSADFDGDGFVSGLDFDAYVLAFEAGC